MVLANPAGPVLFYGDHWWSAVKSLLDCNHYPAQAIKNIIEIKSLRTSDYKIAKIQNVDQAKDPCYLIMHIWSFGGQAELLVGYPGK